jgi:Leucine-rich repeat (LRR) protein
VDLDNVGIHTIENIMQLVNLFSKEQLMAINYIHIENSTIENFYGIDNFIELMGISLYNCRINNFNGISFHDFKFITLRNSVIENLDGIANIERLEHLGIEGCIINNIVKTDFPEHLESIDLNNFIDYSIILSMLPPSIEIIYLNFNNINSLSEIEYLKNYPNLKYIMVGGNNFTIEDLNKEIKNLLPIKLYWWDMP